MNIKGITLVGIVVLTLVVLGLGALVLGRAGFLQNLVPTPPIEETQNLTRRVVGGDFDIDKNTPGYENFQKLMKGCPGGRDCIPSIDNPKFETINQADGWLNDDNVVFVVEHNGEVRAYPQRILNWHEIVNDTVGSEPLVVTFCPLCGSALTFERNVDGRRLEFGVSGFLHNNDLVMYDRQTDTLWQQITGEAIVGEMFGKSLVQVPMSGMLWSRFKDNFSSAEVLSRDTGFSRNYASYPYGDYEQSDSTLFPVEGGVDKTIHPKTVVYGVSIGGEHKAYPEEKIRAQGTIEDSLGGTNLEISYNEGDVVVIRKDTGEEIPATRLFWFAWKAFKPKTELH